MSRLAQVLQRQHGNTLMQQTNARNINWRLATAIRFAKDWTNLPAHDATVMFWNNNGGKWESLRIADLSEKEIVVLIQFTSRKSVESNKTMIILIDEDDKIQTIFPVLKATKAQLTRIIKRQPNTLRWKRHPDGTATISRSQEVKHYYLGRLDILGLFP